MVIVLSMRNSEGADCMICIQVAIVETGLGNVSACEATGVMLRRHERKVIRLSMEMIVPARQD